MKSQRVMTYIENVVFSRRYIWLIALSLITVVLGINARNLEIEAGFKKLLPINHSYIKILEKYQSDFGTGNQVVVALTQKNGTIFNKEFLGALRIATDEVFFLPGVAKPTVTSIFTPNVVYVEVTEDGFRAGRIIPGDFNGSAESMPAIRNNIVKSGHLGSLVARDFSGALIRADLIDIDPTTRKALDYKIVAKHLEDIRKKLETDDISVHIIGFAKASGDIADGAQSVIWFFVLAVVITLCLLFAYTRSIRLSIFPVISALIAVAWVIGALALLDKGLDPMSMLVPFLVFAIGVCHAIQMVSLWSDLMMYGAGYAEDAGLQILDKNMGCMDSLQASRISFRQLLVPSSIALGSDLLGFLTILLIDVGIIREMGLLASVGVGCVVVVNLLVLPLLLSFFKMRGIEKYRVKHQQLAKSRDRIWRSLAKASTKRYSLPIILIAAGLTAAGLVVSKGLTIGDAGVGVSELKADARYNVDSLQISNRFNVGMDKLSVIFEGAKDSCINYEVMKEIERFGWFMENVPGVQSVDSLERKMAFTLAANNEVSPRWNQVSRNEPAMAAAMYFLDVGTAEVSNSDCTAMPVNIFLSDHRAPTVDGVIAAIKSFKFELPEERLRPRLAGGNVAVIAATNETISKYQDDIVVWIYSLVFILCFLTFRTIGGTFCVIIPLAIASLLCYGLMAIMGIGLKVNTLPMVALGVGIGVDYGIYIFARLKGFLEAGMDLEEAFYRTLRTTGAGVIFTGFTLAFGVMVWIFAPLRLQVDVGIMLGFLFLVNMLGAVFLAPALACWVFGNKRRSLHLKP